MIEEKLEQKQSDDNAYTFSLDFIKEVNGWPDWLGAWYIKKRFNLSDYSIVKTIEKKGSGGAKKTFVNDNYVFSDGTSKVAMDFKTFGINRKSKKPKGYDTSWKKFRKDNGFSRSHSINYVKELYGLNGDFIVYVGRTAYVNNEFLDETGVLKDEFKEKASRKPVSVPKGASVSWSRFKKKHGLNPYMLKKDFEKKYDPPKNFFKPYKTRFHISLAYTNKTGELKEEYKSILNNAKQVLDELANK